VLRVTEILSTEMSEHRCCDFVDHGHEFRAFTGLTPTRYVEVRRRFLREHPGHVLDSWPLPAG
jgi:hypothetical protein